MHRGLAGSRRCFEGNPFAFFFQRAVLAKAFVGLRHYEQAARQFEAIDYQLQADGSSLDFTNYTQVCHCCGEHGLATGNMAQVREQAALLGATAVTWQGGPSFS